MATFTPKVIGDGQLPAAKGTLYTVPVGTSTYIHNINVYNTNAATQTVQIFLNTSGTSRRYRQFVLAQDESAEVFTQPVQLQTGDLVEGVTTNAAAVDYVLTGVEQT